ncbi:protein FAM13A-like isoform X2 [Tubulanus polymorphus]|uniref:protein FAM13A-like isoform X2 n=1 Tax=Tubulanus polymorphus TaxID=672921 RepID=UPI003DA55038
MQKDQMVRSVKSKMGSSSKNSEDCLTNVPREMDRMKKILKSPLSNRKHLDVSSAKVFGIHLHELVKTGAESVPQIAQTICEYIIKHAISLEGIFRVNGNAKIVEKLKTSFDKTGEADLDGSGDTYAVAGLLKLFLRELPEGLINSYLTKEFVVTHETYGRTPEICLQKLKVLLDELELENYHLLKYLCRFLVQISLHEVHNKMSPIALSIVFGPNFFKCGEGINGLKDQGITNQIVCKFIVEYDALFKTDDEISPYSIKLIQVQEAVKSKSPPIRPPPPKYDDSPVPSPRRRKKYDQHQLQHRDEDDQSDGGTPRSTRIINSPRISDDEFSRSSSPFILDSDDASFGPSPVVSMCTSDLVEKTISAVISQHMFGDDLSNVSSSDDLSSTPVPAPRKKKRDKAERRYKGVNRLSVPEHNRFHQTDDLYDSEDSETPATKIGSDFVDGKTEDEEADQSPPPTPKPRSPKRKPVIKRPKSPSRETDDAENTEIPAQMIESDDSGFGSIQRTQDALTGFKRTAGPKNRRTPTRGGVTSPRKQGWIKSGDNAEEADAADDRFKTYPPRNSTKLQNDPQRQNGGLDHPDSMANGFKCGSLNNLDIHESASENTRTTIDGASSKPLVPPLDLSTLHEQIDSNEPILAEGGPSIETTNQKCCDQKNNEEQTMSPKQIKGKKTSSHTDIQQPSSTSQTNFMRSNTKPEEDNSMTIKLLTKKIQGLKRKIKQFEDTYEEEFGYRPCQTDKASRPEIRKCMIELAKTRKELKQYADFEDLKEEQREREQYLVDTHSKDGSTGSHDNEGAGAAAADLHHTLEIILKRLKEKRVEGSRPEDLELMSHEQIQDEKLAVQKALLYFESLHGRPNSRPEKELMRPLYDRYRNIKRILSNPSAFSDNFKSVSDEQIGELASSKREPIHVPTAGTMNNDYDNDSIPEFMVTHNPELLRNRSPTQQHSQGSVSGQSLELQHHSSYEFKLHEMSALELCDEQTRARTEKRHLRKVLKDYEDEFYEQTGHKVQKEDRTPMEAEYMSYKRVKAKLRLLEALIAKSEVTSI